MSVSRTGRVRRRAAAGLCGAALTASMLLAPAAAASDSGPATVGAVSSATDAALRTRSVALGRDGRVELIDGRDVRVTADAQGAAHATELELVMSVGSW
ncbi:MULTISPECIES: hypothetical protein [unclassified Streptomyces]|uniref:hypothetical protein n=1 Tax=unclassified Streptomyces TaxID=2593676 RepID=UPI00339E1A96